MGQIQREMGGTGMCRGEGVIRIRRGQGEREVGGDKRGIEESGSLMKFMDLVPCSTPTDVSTWANLSAISARGRSLFLRDLISYTPLFKTHTQVRMPLYTYIFL